MGDIFEFKYEYDFQLPPCEEDAYSGSGDIMIVEAHKMAAYTEMDKNNFYEVLSEKILMVNTQTVDAEQDQEPIKLEDITIGERATSERKEELLELLNNMLIPARDRPELIDRLTQILELLKSAKLTLKLSIYEFAMGRIESIANSLPYT
ncbi:hypothetical protein Trydic_g5766 [Trypoxylus dichotomus]